MKRYWLFEGKEYYPNGGMEDFVGDYDSVDGAKTAFDNAQAAEVKENRKADWAQIADSTTAKIVLWFYGEHSSNMTEYQGWQVKED